jgi:serine/threonine-protein kinase RsbW
VCNAYWVQTSWGAIVNQASALTIKSNLNEIPRVSAAIEELMTVHAFGAEEILDTQLAVEEAITNIILHGYSTGKGEIGITCRAAPHSIEVRIEDSAAPFNPLSLSDPDLSGDVEDRKIGGLGVFLIRQVMDEVSYRRENGKNILILEKRKHS